MTFNFNIFQCFSNISNHLSNFSYLVCISCKIFIRWRFYLFLKTENSRRVPNRVRSVWAFKDCRHERNYRRDGWGGGGGGGGGANLLGQVNVISLGKCFSACNFCSDLTWRNITFKLCIFISCYFHWLFPTTTVAKLNLKKHHYCGWSWNLPIGKTFFWAIVYRIGIPEMVLAST
jgi:hypothetical protein